MWPFHFIGEVRVGDLVAFLYLLATVGIFLETLKALELTRESLSISRKAVG